MNGKIIVWIHPATFTYSRQEPRRLVETIWCHRPGWGYMLRRDLWIRKECDLRQLQELGYVERVAPGTGGAGICPYCGLYISSVPGSMVGKHLAECGGDKEGSMKIEEAMIQDQRVQRFEKQLLAKKLREQEELEEQERRDRFGRIRDEAVARQQAKDRKKRLKDETREELRKR